MPWQHRYQRGRPAPAGWDASQYGDVSSAAHSSQDGSRHAGGEDWAQSLRLPLDRLASGGTRPSGERQSSR